MQHIDLTIDNNRMIATFDQNGQVWAGSFISNKMQYFNATSHEMSAIMALALGAEIEYDFKTWIIDRFSWVVNLQKSKV